MKVLHHVLDARDHIGTERAVREAVAQTLREFDRRPGYGNFWFPAMIPFRASGGWAVIERLHATENRATSEHTITAFWHLDQSGAPWMSTRFTVSPELLAS